MYAPPWTYGPIVGLMAHFCPLWLLMTLMTPCGSDDLVLPLWLLIALMAHIAGFKIRLIDFSEIDGSYKDSFRSVDALVGLMMMQFLISLSMLIWQVNLT